jgi:CBS domain-containing protein
MTHSAITDRIRTLFEHIAPFDELSEDELTDLLTDVAIEYYEPGEVLIEQGSTLHKGLYVVESGTVRLMDVEHQRLLDKCGEGDFFGSFGLIKGGGAIYEAKAVEPTVCALLKASRFIRLYEKHEDFATYFDSDLKRYVRRMDQDMDVTGGHLLFSRRLHQLIHRIPVTCSPTTTARAAAEIMQRAGVDSVVVMHELRMVGIVTTRDLSERLIATGLPADVPVAQIMSSPVTTVGSEASLFEAMMVMLTWRLTRLVVTETRYGVEEPVGILTDRDISHFRGQDPVATIYRIQNAPFVEELVSIRGDTSEQMWRLYRQGLQPEMINRIMSVIYDRLVVRVLELTERELRTEYDHLYVDLPWVWLRLGSSGRREMALNSEQHNALLYANPRHEKEGARAEKWFSLIAEKANASMEACGFKPSQYVARDARWRKPLKEWKKTYREWILQSDQKTLVPLGIFFDLRGIFGQKSLVDELKADIIDAINVQAMDSNRQFLQMMAANALEHKPPLNFFKRFSVERTGDQRYTFDIRDRGTLPVVDAARVLALENRFLDSSNTYDRLRHVAETHPEMEKIIEDLIEAYRFVVDFRLEEQLRAFETGEELNNRIDPYALRKVQQNFLRNVFSTIVEFQETFARRYDLAKKRLLS